MNPLAAIALPNVATAKLIAWAVGLLALAAGLIWLEQSVEHRGAQACEARVAIERAAAESAAASQAMANALRGTDAAAGYRVDEQAITGRLPEIRHDVHQALRAPAACPAGSTIALGDLRIPAAVVGRLRDAGADRAAGPDPAASR
jgi:hypothetical protein